MRKASSVIFLIVVFFVTVAGFFFIYPANWTSWLSSVSPWKLGLDVVGGTHLTYSIDTANIPAADLGDTLAGLRDVIEKRVNLFGVKEPQVALSQSGGKQYIVIDLAGVSDVNEAIKQIGETPFLEFREVQGEGEKAVFVPTDPQLNGRFVKSAKLSFDNTTNKPQVSIEFTSEGADIFAKVTEKNIGKVVGIFLDGTPISQPVVNERIPGGQAVISGSFTVQEAKELVQRFNAGALPAPITLENQQTIGASLGKSSLEMSLIAGIIGTLLVMLFMISYYHWRGLLASCALIVYIVLSLVIFKLFVTMSLAGIAGFLLSIGMAVDANVLIFERTKEEIKKGLAPGAAIHEGFRRAWSSIRDSNVSTIITTLILFYFTSSFIKGLALTLLLGVLVSMFTAITVTRNLMIVFHREPKNVK